MTHTHTQLDPSKYQNYIDMYRAHIIHGAINYLYISHFLHNIFAYLSVSIDHQFWGSCLVFGCVCALLFFDCFTSTSTALLAGLVAQYFDERNPAVMKGLETLIKAAKAKGKWLGLWRFFVFFLSGKWGMILVGGEDEVKMKVFDKDIVSWRFCTRRNDWNNNGTLIRLPSDEMRWQCVTWVHVDVQSWCTLQSWLVMLLNMLIEHLG